MKTYVVAKVQVLNFDDIEKYDALLLKIEALVVSFGGRFLTKGTSIESVLGYWKPDRLIIIEFDDRTTLWECFNSQEYIALSDSRPSSVSFDVVIAE